MPRRNTRIERNLTELELAASIPNATVRRSAYIVVARKMSVGELENLVMVLAEGNQHGPDAARDLAAAL